MKSISKFLKDHKGVFLSIFVVWLIFFISVVFLTKDISLSFTPSMTSSNLGVFGDSFNVLTSLFTGLAFAGVIISVVLQTQELKEAREEFSGQRKALENQQYEMTVQSFDNKFFQMLNLFNNVVENLTYRTVNRMSRERELHHGREVIQLIKNDLESRIISREYNNLNLFQIIFDQLNAKYDTTFKYCFINLYQILKYIDKNSNIEENPKEYTNIVRAQLSKDELVLLFYNAYGVIEFSGEHYKNLIEKYALFEHLNYNDLNPDGKNHIVDLLLLEYKEEAFGKNEALKEKWVQLQFEHPNSLFQARNS
jgi:hypothetical protein